MLYRRNTCNIWAMIHPELSAPSSRCRLITPGNHLSLLPFWYSSLFFFFGIFFTALSVAIIDFRYPENHSSVPVSNSSFSCLFLLPLPPPPPLPFPWAPTIRCPSRLFFTGLFVDGLYLFVDGLEFFVDDLEFFVDVLELFVEVFYEPFFLKYTLQ